MKKIFAAAAIALLMFTSCSDDSSSNNGTNTVLIKKMIEQYQDGSIVTILYDYEGTKLSGISQSDGQGVNFTYTGDQVTKVEYLENNAMVRWSDFTYDTEGRVVQMIEYGYEDAEVEEGEDPVQLPWANRTTYTYNGDGTISLVKYTGDHETQTEVSEEGTLTVVEGNVTKYASVPGNSTYIFDANNNPEKNITGIDAINIAWQYGGVNNLTSATYSNGTGAYSATYTYNSDQYPVTAIEEEGGQTTHIWYMY
jgi:hypothetical protein